MAEATDMVEAVTCCGDPNDCTCEDIAHWNIAEGMVELVRHTTMKNTIHPALERWYDAIGKLHDIADAKRADYGNDEHPFANILQSEEFDVPAWLSAVIRLNDKVTRIKSFRRNGRLRNESLEDSLLDIANYALIALALLDEEGIPDGS